MKSLLVVVAVVASLAFAGTTFAADGAKIFAEKCSACHGAKGAGTPGMAPALKGNEFLTKGDAGEIKKIITGGRAGKDKKYANLPIDMPAAPLPDADLDVLVKFLQGDLQK